MGDDMAAVLMALFWGVALTGLSTYLLPSVEAGDCLIFLFAGRCHLILAEARARKRIARLALRYATSQFPGRAAGAALIL
jgi:hypothetical protein